MKAIEQYFAVVLFTMLYKMVIWIVSSDKFFKWEYSNESYRAELFYGSFIMLQGGLLTFECVDKTWIYWKLLSCSFIWC